MKQSKLETVLPYIIGYVVLLATALLFQRPGGPPFDLPVYYCSGQLERAGDWAKVYDAFVLGRLAQHNFSGQDGLPLKNYFPPFACWILFPLGLIPAHLVSTVWLAFTALLVVLSLALASGAYGFGGRGVFRQLAGAIFFGPIFETFRHGQVTPLGLFALSLFVYAWKRNEKISSALALSILSLRPHQLLPLVAILLGTSQYMILGYLVIVLLLGTVVSLFTFGYAGWRNYFLLLSYGIEHTGWMQVYLGPTLRGQLLLLFPDYLHPVMVVTLFITMAALIAIFVISRRLRHVESWQDKCLVLGLPLGMVTAPYYMNYDILLLWPALWSAWHLKLLQGQKRGLKLAVALSALIFFMPIYYYIHYGYIRKGALLNPFFLALGILAVVPWFIIIKQMKNEVLVASNT